MRALKVALVALFVTLGVTVVLFLAAVLGFGWVMSRLCWSGC